MAIEADMFGELGIGYLGQGVGEVPLGINRDLLNARLLRGSLRGAPTEESKVTRYCKGKLDNGRPCRVVMIGDEDFCLRHKKEIEALEAGAPLRPGRVERPQKETEMAKFRCGVSRCGRPVRNEGDKCWQHKGLEDQVEAGMAEVAQTAGTGQEDVTGAVAAGESASTASVEIIERKSLDQATPEEWNAAAASLKESRRSGLEALLRPPPPMPHGLLIPFSQEEIDALVESEVTVEHIRQLVIMGMEGELQPVIRVA